MADGEVTFDEVAGAAASLQKDGQPVTVDAVRDALAGGSASIIYRHLALWRANNVKPAPAPKAELPKALLADLAKWAIQYAEEAGAGSRANLEQAENDLEALRESGEQLEAERDDLQGQVETVTAERDDALAALAERDETIERLQAELRNAKQVAMDALVGKAKDQLAIEGKDNQIASLRAQLEKNVAAQATESDARLNAEMELIGATTARDSLAAEVKELRDQIAALRKR
jgi:chromosome segregation ATPase